MKRRLRAIVPALVVYAVLLGVGLGLSARFAVVRVSGGSMAPTLHPGDVVVVARKDRPIAGDVVLMHAGESLVLHRVMRVDADGSVHTKGDANPIEDFSATDADDLRGRVCAVVELGALLERWRRHDTYATLPAQTHSTRR